MRKLPDFLEHFDHVTFSYELRVVKPQAAIYQDAIQGLGVASGDALFLDDRPDNVEGARGVGMQAELYATWEAFAADAPLRYGLPGPDGNDPRRALR